MVFTQSKSFVANPVLGNWVLNRMGLHVLRLVLAHGARRIRLLFISPFIDKNVRQEYWQNGFDIIENFISEDEFSELNKAVRSNAKSLEVKECIQGDTFTHWVLLDDAALNILP